MAKRRKLAEFVSQNVHQVYSRHTSAPSDAHNEHPLPEPAVPTGGNLSSPSHDYELNVIASTVLNRNTSLMPSAQFLSSTSVERCLADVLGLAQASIPTASIPTASSSIVPLISPAVDENGYSHPLGLPRARHQATVNALVLVESLKKRAEVCMSTLTSLSHVNGVDAEKVLYQTDIALLDILKKLQSVTRQEAADLVQETIRIVTAAGELVKEWRERYPDTSPVKIDNDTAAIDLSRSYYTPSLIAYTHALVLRIFDGLGQRGANLVLKMMKTFAISLFALGSDANVEQSKAIEDIPDDIRTVEQRFNLDVKTVTYAVCPECAFMHKPRLAIGSTQFLYPEHCVNVEPGLDSPCGVQLLKDGRPLKTFQYYPFFSWFGRFLALPDIENYGDTFCDTIARNPVAPSCKKDTSDGSIYRHFKGPDGRLFVADRGEEGRWMFLLHCDFFNIEGNLIGGKHHSTGVMSMTCLNLPLELRNDPAYTYIPGIIQGPREPKADDAQHRHYLRPLVEDLEVGYTRGVSCATTYESSRAGAGRCSRTDRLLLAGLIMDFKAARPFAGFLDVSSHIFCFICDVWHQSHIGRTDYENWNPCSDARLRTGSETWRNAPRKDRTDIEHIYGTRDSALWQLPYFQPSLQQLVDPMHAFILVLIQRMYRLGLRLEDPRSTSNPKNKQNAPKSQFSHHYAFTPPPPLQTLGLVVKDISDDDDDVWVMLPWSNLTDNARSLREQRALALRNGSASTANMAQGIAELHQKLSYPCPVDTASRYSFTSKVSNSRWAELAYVCNDLMVFPSEKLEALTQRASLVSRDLTKFEMARALLDWRVSLVETVEAFDWPFFAPKGGLHFDASWAHRPIKEDRSEVRWLNPEERVRELTDAGARLNQRAAVAVGQIHRFLWQAMDVTEEAETDLRKKISGKPESALKYVCIDINRLPNGVKVNKNAIVDELVRWRLAQPRKAIAWTAVDSPGLLDRIHMAIREVVVPSWMPKPPSEFGLPKAGTLKADDWRKLCVIYVPLALLSLWHNGSPIAAADAEEMQSVLETCMWLTCTCIVMMKKTLRSGDPSLYRTFLRNHVLGLKKTFPDVITSSHHLAFHIADGMESFGPVRNASCFPGERLIGRLRDIPINHQQGEYEGTLLHSFCKGAGFRQWLLRPDCPPLLRYCRTLLDKAYSFTPESVPAADTAASSSDRPGAAPSAMPENPSRIPAARGFYTVPTASGKGNSFICFRPEGDAAVEWVPAQIQRIHQRDGQTTFTVRRSKSLASRPEAFRLFWQEGFEAKMVSSRFSVKTEEVEMAWVVGHIALWEIAPNQTVVLNLNHD